jgi:hypothetical protein
VQKGMQNAQKWCDSNSKQLQKVMEKKANAKTYFTISLQLHQYAYYN